jgi:hypothetical protein
MQFMRGFRKPAMKHISILISILAVAACGGSKPQTAKPKAIPLEPDPPPVAEAKPEPAPAPEPPPPPPKTWHAEAELAPLKGVKIKTTTITFTQEEGQPAAIASNGWFTGIKAGKYHLVVHEGTDCGPAAAKAGKPMGTATIPFAAAKTTTALEVSQAVPVQLDGDGAVVGHALVLHEDKKGKAGRALACGAIRMVE